MRSVFRINIYIRACPQALRCYKTLLQQLSSLSRIRPQRKSNHSLGIIPHTNQRTNSCRYPKSNYIQTRENAVRYKHVQSQNHNSANIYFRSKSRYQSGCSQDISSICTKAIHHPTILFTSCSLGILSVNILTPKKFSSSICSLSSPSPIHDIHFDNSELILRNI